MEKVTYKELKNALVHVDNSGDSDRVYDISADIRLQGQTVVESYESGSVMKDNAQVATFNCWGDISNINIQYYNVESQDQYGVLNAVTQFMEAVKNKVDSTDTGVLPEIETSEEEIDTMQLKFTRMIINNVDMSVQDALDMIDLFPHWEDCIGKELQTGFKLQYGGMLYQTLDKTTPYEGKEPGKETEDIYKLLTTE